MPHEVKHHDIQNTVEVQVKYYGSTYWKGRIHKDSPTSVFMEPWNYLMSLAGNECPIRAVVQAQQVSNETIISTINRREKMTIYWVLPSWGGAKENVKFLAKNQLAHQLLGKGIPVAKVASYVDTIVQAIGANKVIKDIKEGDANTHWKNVQKWIDEAGLKPVEPSTEFDKAATRIQNAFRKKQNNRVPMVEISKLQIEPSFFTKEDGTPAICIGNIECSNIGSLPHGSMLHCRYPLKN